MKKIALTGYSGFVGSFLLRDLLEREYNVLCLGRKPVSECAYYRSDLDCRLDYGSVLEGVDTVVHCAARVHIMSEQSDDPLSEYRKVNTLGTINFAKQAIDAGVKRFIFISSIKVNGESSGDTPFLASDVCNPTDLYARSKFEAEIELRKLSKSSGMDVVIIRPPLIYGPGVKANFASLLNLVSKNIPLPFGCIKGNRRSLVSVNNLVDLIITCIEHPMAANEIFLVSDEHDLSTANLVQNIGYALGKSTFLLPVPLWCYYLAGKLLSKNDVVERLLGSLQVDITHTKDVLNWTPPQSLEDGFKEAVQAFMSIKKG